MNDDALVFFDETKNEPVLHTPPWLLLLVDDEPMIHQVTELSLNNVTFDERPLKFLHSYSGIDAIDKLTTN